VIEWADRMVLLLEIDVDNMPRLDDPEQWQAWATSIFGEPDVSGQDSPDPYAFDTWQEWGERLFQTQDYAG